MNASRVRALPSRDYHLGAGYRVMMPGPGFSALHGKRVTSALTLILDKCPACGERHVKGFVRSLTSFGATHYAVCGSTYLQVNVRWGEVTC